VCLVLLAQASFLAVQATPARDPIAGTFIYPVGNPNVAPSWDPANTNGYFITQGFNNSCDPSLGQGYYAYGLYYCGHTGVDLATQGADATVHATAAGVVTEAQEDGSYGVVVRLRHLLPNGVYVYSQYEHMQYGSLEVSVGEAVSQGQALGLVGATGFAIGAHLHFEIKDFDGGGVGYTFGNQAEIADYYDPLAFVAAHMAQPTVLVTAPGPAIPEWPAETDAVLRTFLAQYQHYVVVSVDSGLNVRSGPGTGYRTLGVALRGAKLGYLGAHGQWLRVALPQNVRGWVNKQWVTGYGGWATPWPPQGPIAIVNLLGLNIHASPGQRNTVVGVCFEGDIVAVRAHTANWTEVRTREGTRGWVLSRYLLPPGVHGPHGGGITITATADVLHVRAGPGVNYMLIGTIFRGTSMELVRLTPHWAAVILPGGTTGWVARPYTSLAGPARRAATTGNARTVGVVTLAKPRYLRAVPSVLNLHSAPGLKRPVVARVFAGTRLQVLGLTTHWAHVALPATSIEGWALRSLLH
jgi:murein DD-endopeptidase MepM/ murein hydrolase activator NlpD/SH3-like domain-containing protein